MDMYTLKQIPSEARIRKYLKHAVRFFAPAFSFVGIKTDSGTEFVYDQFPQVPIGNKVGCHRHNSGWLTITLSMFVFQPAHRI